MQNQRFQQAQVEIQEQKFTVQEDCINVMQSLIDANEVLKYFKDQPDHPMIRVTTNRLICQINLSNTIHFDLKETAESQNIHEQLNGSKNLCRNLCQIYFQTNPFDSRLSTYLEHYLNQNLNKNTVINQMQGLPSINQQPQFDQKVITKIIEGMAQTDNRYESIRKGEKIETLTMQQIQTRIENRRQQTVQKIENNWAQIKKSNIKKDNGKYYKTIVSIFIGSIISGYLIFYKYQGFFLSNLTSISQQLTQ